LNAPPGATIRRWFQKSGCSTTGSGAEPARNTVEARDVSTWWSRPATHYVTVTVHADPRHPRRRAPPSSRRITPAGEALLAESRELLDRAARAKDRVMAVGAGRTLVVGSVAGAGLDIGPRARDLFREVRPQATIRLRECAITDPAGGCAAATRTSH
jgi:hypothetical protein